MVSSSPDFCVKVIGKKGELCIAGAGPARPTKLVLRKWKGSGPFVSASEWDEEPMDFPLPGVGLGFEADEVARLVKAGEKTSARCSPADTLAVMAIMDEWRAQSGYKYPAGLEKA